MGNVLRRALGLGARDWWALVVAILSLARARAVFGRVPAEVLVRELVARSEARAAQGIAAAGGPGLERWRWAIAAAARRVPWRADCLIQTIAAERMLVRRGFRPAFFLGVERTDAGHFSAHAWLQCGEVVVTGGAVAGMAVMLGSDAPDTGT